MPHSKLPRPADISAKLRRAPLGVATLVTAGALLLGCTTPPGGSPAGDTGMSPQLCGADRFADLKGQPVTRLPGDELNGPIRVIRPGDPVTMDLNHSRLNVELDRNDRISRLFCG